MPPHRTGTLLRWPLPSLGTHLLGRDLVLQRIGQSAAYSSVSRGLLLGVESGDGIEIVEPRWGSPQELPGIAASLPAEGLTVAGWFRSAGPGHLTAEDIVYWEQHTRILGPLFLVITPPTGEGADYPLFVRTEGQPLSAGAEPALTLRIPPLTMQAAASQIYAPEPLAQPLFSGGPVHFPAMEGGIGLARDFSPNARPSAATIETSPEQEPPPELLSLPAEPSWLARNRHIAGAAGLAVVLACLWLFWPSPGQAEARPSAQLRLILDQGMVEAVWDPTAEVLQGATGGSLEIRDGDQQATFPLTPADLRRGRLPLTAQSHDIHARIEVSGSGERKRFTELARLISKPPDAPSASPELEVSRRRILELQTRLDQQIAANSAMEIRIDRLRYFKGNRRGGAESISPQPEERSTPQPPPVTPPVSAPATVPDAGPQPARYAGPSRGRIVWSGDLPADAVLTISGGRPSSGALTASLPPVAVRVSVQPAELGSNGLAVYSANPRYADGQQTEPGSQATRGLSTRYVYDPSRASSLQVVGAPQVSGGAARVQIRSVGRPATAIVIDWEVAR